MVIKSVRPALIGNAWASLLLSIALAFQGHAGVSDLSLAQNIATLQFVVVATYIGVSAAVIHRTFIHPYVFFILTSSLFVGGRFFARAIGLDLPLFFNDGFNVINLTAEEAMTLMGYVTPVYLAIHAGYLAYCVRSGEPAEDTHPPAPTAFERSLWLPAAAILAVSIPLAAYGQYSQYVSACLTGDYMSLYSSKIDFALRAVSMAQYGLLLALGLSLASGNRTVLATSMVALALYYLVSLGFGIRSGFLSFALLATWVIHKRVRRLSWRTMLIVPILMLVLAQASIAFSCRTSVTVNAEVAGSVSARADHFVQSVAPNRALLFAYDQGTTLLSIHVASTIEGYPWPAFVQTFIPGFGAVAALAGKNVPLSELYFGQYMASEWIEPMRYEGGEGFGWSIVSDMIVFSGKNPFLLVLFSAVLGYAFSAAIFASQAKAIWFGALGLVIPKIALLPRAGLYSIFPYLLAFLVIVGSWWVVRRGFSIASQAQNGVSASGVRRRSVVKGSQP